MVIVNLSMDTEKTGKVSRKKKEANIYQVDKFLETLDRILFRIYLKESYQQ